jgi:hypothetical protein
LRFNSYFTDAAASHERRYRPIVESFRAVVIGELIVDRKCGARHSHAREAF